MTTPPSGRLAVAGAALLVGVLAGGCGGGIDASSAPKDATTDDFCLTWVKGVTATVAKMQASLVDDRTLPSGEALADLSRTWAEEMRDVGTPAGIPAEARRRFETYLEESANLDADTLDPDEMLEADVDLVGEWAELSSEDFNGQRALNTYLMDTCSPLWRERGLL